MTTENKSALRTPLKADGDCIESANGGLIAMMLGHSEDYLPIAQEIVRRVNLFDEVGDVPQQTGHWFEKMSLKGPLTIRIQNVLAKAKEQERYERTEN